MLQGRQHPATTALMRMHPLLHVDLRIWAWQHCRSCLTVSLASLPPWLLPPAPMQHMGRPWLQARLHPAAHPASGGALQACSRGRPCLRQQPLGCAELAGAGIGAPGRRDRWQLCGRQCMAYGSPFRLDVLWAHCRVQCTSRSTSCAIYFVTATCREEVV